MEVTGDYEAPHRRLQGPVSHSARVDCTPCQRRFRSAAIWALSGTVPLPARFWKPAQRTGPCPDETGAADPGVPRDLLIANRGYGVGSARAVRADPVTRLFTESSGGRRWQRSSATTVRGRY
jgi:hypothetical protein